MERVDDDVEVWKLFVSERSALETATDHSTNREVWAHALFLTVFLDVVQRVHPRRNQVSRLVIVEFLFVS